MTVARSAVVFGLGLFAMAAQTLLFRDFLTAFEGNELGVGAFFGSWLVWVALGALVGRHEGRLQECVVRRFESVTLLYLPAYLLQRALIANARALAGVAMYEMFPFTRLAAAAFLVNAPVSLVTGFLFPMACRWAAGRYPLRRLPSEVVPLQMEPTEKKDGLPVARIYVLETMGAMAGGVAATVLLYRGASNETVFLASALVVTIAAAWCVVRDFRRTGIAHVALTVMPAVLVFAALVFRIDAIWAERADHSAWMRLLPRDAYRGRFTTAQAKYLYGEREGQFIVMSYGGVCEALPDTEHAAEVAAVNLAQCPRARSVLVIGPGSLGLCAQLARIPQIERITWLHPDPQYPSALMRLLPEAYRPAAKIEVPGADVRTYLTLCRMPYDLAIVNLPDVTTLVLSRYATVDFLTLLAHNALADDGVVSLRISGGANYMGGELVYLGASALKTLETCFSHTALKAGDESWLFGCRLTGVLSEDPVVLRDRFSRIASAAEVYPPEGLLSLYLPDRIELQMSKYRETVEVTDPGILINTDRQPRGLLYGLLVALRRGGMGPAARFLSGALGSAAWLCAVAIVMYCVLRLTYLARSPRREHAAPAPFDVHFLVFSTGLASMSLTVVLMFLYQSRFGSLFLHIGLITSLFMLGTFVGSLASEQVLTHSGKEPRCLLVTYLLTHLLFMVFVPGATSGQVSHGTYAGLFSLAGVFTGVYFPLAAHRMKCAGQGIGLAGSNLEMSDHLGGAAGAVMTGLFLLPVLGGPLTLGLLAMLVSVNCATGWLWAVSPGRRDIPSDHADWFDRLTRPMGYTMFGLGAFVLIASHVWAHVHVSREEQRLLDAARSLAPNASWHEEQVRLADGSAFTYFSDGAGGHVFSTKLLVKDVTGYAGPITLAVYADDGGVLRGLRVIESKETPAYMALLSEWLDTLTGRNLFQPDPFKNVDAVSGATVTSEAILGALATAGNRFAREVLGRTIGEGPARSRAAGRDSGFIWLTLFMLGAVALRYRPLKWPRRGFLLASLLITGVWLNLQYSSQQVASFLRFDVPIGGWNGSLFLLVFIPVLVLLFGNVYCGYVCPFGALQELVGELRPTTFHSDPDKRVWRYGRAVKYALLFLIVCLFALNRGGSVLSADPLVTVFGAARDPAVITVGLTLLAAAFFFRRFWCRNLCPAGAFLALLGGLQLLRRFMPATRPASCDLGVRSGAELDCIRCDRCRHENH